MFACLLIAKSIPRSAQAAMLYFRQLLPGRDIAIHDEDSVDALSEQELQERELLYQLAITMQNYVYLIGDTSTGECFVVDGKSSIECPGQK